MVDFSTADPDFAVLAVDGRRSFAEEAEEADFFAPEAGTFFLEVWEPPVFDAVFDVREAVVPEVRRLVLFLAAIGGGLSRSRSLRATGRADISAGNALG